MDYIIVKKSKDGTLEYLYRDRKGRYIFTGSPGVTFSTEEAAINFLHYNSPAFTNIMNEGDTIFVTHRSRDDI